MYLMIMKTLAGLGARVWGAGGGGHLFFSKKKKNSISLLILIRCSRPVLYSNHKLLQGYLLSFVNISLLIAIAVVC